MPTECVGTGNQGAATLVKPMTDSISANTQSPTRPLDHEDALPRVGSAPLSPTRRGSAGTLVGGGLARSAVCAWAELGLFGDRSSNRPGCGLRRPRARSDRQPDRCPIRHAAASTGGSRRAAGTSGIAAREHGPRRRPGTAGSGCPVESARAHFAPTSQYLMGGRQSSRLDGGGFGRSRE